MTLFARWSKRLSFMLTRIDCVHGSCLERGTDFGGSKHCEYKHGTNETPLPQDNVHLRMI
jgi:hypothetical protein